MKKRIESQRVLGEKIFEVWINEDGVADAEPDSWQECMTQARDCDIFIALYNGNAGWPGKDNTGTVGICHAELQTAWEQAPGKVFIINISELSAPGAPASSVDKLFQAYIERANRFGASARDRVALEQAIDRTVAGATVKLVQRGVKNASRGSGYLGPALEWNRLSYSARSAKMVSAVRSALDAGKPRKFGDNSCVRTVLGKKILFALAAVPDSMSVPAARELVGQPHLADHLQMKALSSLGGGPVHFIACHKRVSGAQAQRMLGFPNATVVAAPFGIYAFDPVQGIQLVLISDCGDEIGTRHGIQNFLEWLDQSEQAEALAKGACKRKIVVSALVVDA